MTTTSTPTTHPARSEAEIIGRVTGSRAATVIHEHRDPATGELVVDSREEWTR